MDYAEACKIVTETMTRKSKTKSKYYFSDLAKMIGEKPRPAKKFVNQMVTDGILEYWSSGSTSMYGLKGMGKQAHGEGEEE
jgi:hypothetical protein